LLERLFAQLGKKIEADYTESRPGDVRHSYADVSKLKQDFGLQPTVSFEEGLKRTIAFFEQQQLASRSV
jgi:nucleoside-diphosphate-sugar epimerase